MDALPVLPVVAIVAAIQEGQFGFNFSRCLLRDSKSSGIYNSGGRFGCAARAPRTTRSLNLNLVIEVARGELSNGLVEAGSNFPKRVPPSKSAPGWEREICDGEWLCWVRR